MSMDALQRRLLRRAALGGVKSMFSVTRRQVVGLMGAAAAVLTGVFHRAGLCWRYGDAVELAHGG
jgi:hypothetical protein